MCSTGAKNVQFPGRGPYSFVIQGQVYHNTSHLVAASGQQPQYQYAQLYVMDFDEANQHRQNHPANINCIPRIFHDIHQWMLVNKNPYVEIYQNMKDIMNREEAIARQNQTVLPLIRMDFKRDDQLLPGQHPRRYNIPLCNEVAMIFVDPNGEPPFERDIRVYRKNPINSQFQFEQVNILSANLEPMAYPVLNPRGDRGWGVKWQLEQYDNRVRKQVFAVAQLNFLTLYHRVVFLRINSS